MTSTTVPPGVPRSIALSGRPSTEWPNTTSWTKSGTGGVVATAEVVGAVVVGAVLAVVEVPALEGGSADVGAAVTVAAEDDDDSDLPPHAATSSAVATRSAARTRGAVTSQPRPWP